MKISTSLLSIWKDPTKIKEVDHSLTDYVHLDVTDGIFTKNKSYYNNISSFEKKVDIHLMVENVKEEVDKYIYLKPEYITFHIENNSPKEDTINYIKEKGIKVGIALNPNTEIEEVVPYLPKIDLVLLLAVNPGYGEQTFIKETIEKIKKLQAYKKQYSFMIEVDGGINKDTVKNCIGVDILVVGSFITLSNNYNKRILELKEKFYK